MNTARPSWRTLYPPEYTPLTSRPLCVIGETTNLASRLQGRAEGGEIVLSVETYRRVRDWIAASAYESTETQLELKGFTEPVATQRLRRQPAI